MDPYRHADELLLERRDALLGARHLEAMALIASESPAVAVYVRRWVRSAFGVAGILMAGLLVWAALTGTLPLTPILDTSWLVLGIIVLGARPRALRALRRTVDQTLAPTDDPYGDVAALEATTAEATIGAAADRLEERSVALPLVALALLLPLTLHRLGAVVLGGLGARLPVPWSSGRPMDAWIRCSMVVVGHCHVLLAVLAVAFARDLRRHADLPETALAERAGWAAFAWTSLASIPAATLCLTLWPLEGWIPFLLIPTLVTLTGVAFIPASFQVLGRAVARERELIRIR
jgi:hypothetical protein